jgi:hypothetical protein
MLAFALSLLGGLPALLKEWLGYKSKQVDATVDTTRIHTEGARDVTTASITGTVETTKVLADVQKAAMNHPVYWWAWGAFVFPVAMYHGCIFWVSTFPGLGWAIQRVPQAQEDFAHLIVLSMFGLHGSLTVIDRIASAWTKKT